jgi:hypothetical protein
MNNTAEEIATLEHSDIVLTNAHTKKECYSEYRCTLHNRSNHHMREFPQMWNGRKQIMERLCEHGYGHTDPDEISGFEIHNCDGCCAKLNLDPTNAKSQVIYTSNSSTVFEARWAIEGLTTLESVLKSAPYIKYDKEGYSNHLFSFRGTSINGGDISAEMKYEPNFVFKNLGIHFSWEENLSRNIVSNIDQLDLIDWYIVINACVQSLRMG